MAAALAACSFSGSGNLEIGSLEFDLGFWPLVKNSKSTLIHAGRVQFAPCFFMAIALVKPLRYFLFYDIVL